MSKVELVEERRTTSDMTVLDVVDRYRNTESVFRKYDQQAGVCICCQALFETIGDVAAKYGLNLGHFLSDLEDAISL